MTNDPTDLKVSLEAQDKNPELDPLDRTDEIGVIARCYRDLSSLDARAQARVLDWLEARIKWDHETKAQEVGRGI